MAFSVPIRKGRYKVAGIPSNPNPTPPPVVVTDGLRPPVTSLTPITIQNIAKPGYLQPVIDNTYGYPVKITRITTGGAPFNKTSPYILDPGYSKQQNWNLDGTLYKRGRRDLLNGKTYAFIKSMGTPSGVTLWSNTRADRLLVVGGGKIGWFNPNVPAASAYTMLIDMAALGYDSDLSVGEAEGNIDNFDKHVVVTAKKGGLSKLYYILVDLQTAQVISEVDDDDLGATASGGTNWVAISQDGNRIVANFNNTGGKHLYDLNWNLLRNLNSGDHMDFSIHPDGRKIMTRANHPRAVFLETGQNYDLIPAATMAAYYGSNAYGGHSSGQNIDFPGWSLHSFTSENNATKEVMAIKNDGSGQLMRFCPMRYTRYDYDGESQASPNRDLTKVTFASDWGGGANGSVDSYVAEMATEEDVILYG